MLTLEAIRAKARDDLAESGLEAEEIDRLASALVAAQSLDSSSF